MKRRKKRKTLDQILKRLVIPRLRQASRYWPPKKTARKLAKVKVQIGTFNNGNPKYKTMFKCAKCHKDYDLKDTQADHRHPAIDPDVGFVSWDVYIKRLFTTVDGYQILCTFCHSEKTLKENKKRRENKS